MRDVVVRAWFSSPPPANPELACQDLLLGIAALSPGLTLHPTPSTLYGVLQALYALAGKTLPRWPLDFDAEGPAFAREVLRCRGVWRYHNAARVPPGIAEAFDRFAGALEAAVFGGNPATDPRWAYHTLDDALRGCFLGFREAVRALRRARLRACPPDPSPAVLASVLRARVGHLRWSPDPAVFAERLRALWHYARSRGYQRELRAVDEFLAGMAYINPASPWHTATPEADRVFLQHFLNAVAILRAP